MHSSHMVACRQHYNGNKTKTTTAINFFLNSSLLVSFRSTVISVCHYVDRQAPHSVYMYIHLLLQNTYNLIAITSYYSR